jgi:HK97 family phage major capsid protein
MFVTLKKSFLGQPAGKTIDVSDDDGKALVAQGIAEAAPANPLEPLLAKSLEGLFGKVTSAVEQSVDAALKQFADNLTKSKKNQLPALFGAGQKGDPAHTFGKFLLAVRTRDQKALEAMGSHFVEWNGKAALATQSGTTGGYLVPTEFHDKLMALVAEKSVVRSRAMVIPMSSREIDIPYLDVTTAPSAGDTATLGGLVARWTEEGADKNQTEPQFKQAKLINYELSGYSKLSNSLVQDAPGLEAFLYNLFAQAIAWYEDYAFLRGDGVGKPLGPVVWTGLISVTRSAASAFALADYAGCLARWLGDYDPKRCCWAVHPTVLAKLFTMNASGTGSPLVFLPEGHAGMKPKLVLGGLPVEITEKLPALNTAGDVLLADWSKYVIGDRQQIEIAFSEHAGFTTNQTFWRFVSRVAGQPWMRDKITLADASNTLSPFVTLAAG